MTHNDIKNITYLDVVKSPRFSYTKQKDVFWPFLLWRVLAPKSQPELNVFQVLILKLLKAGCSSKESICEYSNLDGLNKFNSYESAVLNRLEDNGGDFINGSPLKKSAFKDVVDRTCPAPLKP